jgi:hypothetical protein
MFRKLHRWLGLLGWLPALLAQRGPEWPVRPSSDSRPIPIRVAVPRYGLTQDAQGWWFTGPDRAGFDPENPAYAWWRTTPDLGTWATQSAHRVGEWGFTTLGAWSDVASFTQERAPRLLLTPVLHAGASAGAPWWDLWDPRNLRRMEATARGVIEPLAGDPRVVGYYSDNELGWWNASLWKSTLEQPPTSGQRRRLVGLLREHYANDWTRLLADFEPEGARNWRDLERGGMVFLRPGGEGIHVQRRFLGVLADRYYSVMRELIRRLDPGALYLGDRYQSFYYPEVVTAAARYVDVLSSNLNSTWNDGSFPRFQLETLASLSGRPLLVSEFYLAARQNRSGNRNSHGVYPVVEDQAARARSAAHTLRRLAELPSVVGADWFQFSDEPRHGRADGENFNFGLVDLEDRPYEELTQAFRAFKARELRRQPASARPDARSGIPRAPADPFARFERTHALAEWDRERGFVPPASEHPLADLYVGWNPNGLYLGLVALDLVESAYYRSTSMPKVDRAQWTLSVGGRPVGSARIGAGREALVTDERIRVESLSGMDVDVRNVAVMEVPVSVLGRAGLAAGQEVELEVAWVSHARARRVEWRGRFRLD